MNQVINIQNLIMSKAQLMALVPYLIVAVGSMISLLACTLKFGTAKKPSKILNFAITIITLAACVFVSVNNAAGDPHLLFNDSFKVDYFGQFFNVLICASGILVLFASYSYLEREEIHYSEFYPLTLLAVLGMMCMVASVDLISIFISLELMSLAVYVLVGLRREDRKSNEAAVKYFVMGGVASSVLLYGVALIYGSLNSTNLVRLSEVLQVNGINISQNPVFMGGLLLLFIGFFFKIALAPFQLWTPDVYEGSPINVTSFMSTALKAAAFAIFIRIAGTLWGSDNQNYISNFGEYLKHIMWWLALATMIFGNVVALMQNNIKRMLAYSAIAHTGYLMLGFIVGPIVGFSGILVYLIPYSVMNIGAFSVLSLTSGKFDNKLNIEEFRGFGYRHPYLAFALTVFLVSLAGLPPTGGFVGKYFLFSSALQGGEGFLVLLGVLTSLISVYYYMRVVIFMYMKDEEKGKSYETVITPPYLNLTTYAIAICLILILQIGIFPATFLSIASKASGF